MNEYFKLSPEKLLRKKGIILNDVQKEIVKSVNDFQVTVVVATRRGGKSEIASACNTAKLIEPGKYCGLTAPFMTQTSICFDNIADTFQDTLQIKPTKLNNKDKQLKLEWGSELKATTLKNRKTIAGRAYDLFTGDEIGLADYMEDANWLYQEVIPALITVQGHVLIISTPRGLNHLYDLWQKAETEKAWNRIRYTIYDVEHIDKAEIEKMERLYKDQGMEKVFHQEFLAEFISFEGQIFSFMPQITSTSPDPDLILTGIDPGTNTGFVKVHVHKKHGVFVTFASETESSTYEHGKMLQEHTTDADLNVYDPAAKQFAVDIVYEFDISLTKAKKEVEEGVNFLRRLEGNLYVLDTVDDVFIREWSQYSMKNDKIVKKNDHVIDAIRYALYTAFVYWPEYFEFLTEEVESLWDL